MGYIHTYNCWPICKTSRRMDGQENPSLTRLPLEMQSEATFDRLNGLANDMTRDMTSLHMAHLFLQCIGLMRAAVWSQLSAPNDTTIESSKLMYDRNWRSSWGAYVTVHHPSFPLLHQMIAMNWQIVETVGYYTERLDRSVYIVYNSMQSLLKMV